MKRMLLFLAFILVGSWAYADEVIRQGTINETELFVTNDDVIKGECKPQCRQVGAKFKALVVGFDPQSGITSCIIVPKDDFSNTLGINANTKNTTCIEETNQTVDDGFLSNGLEPYKSNLGYKPAQMTLTRFLAGVVTLDPAVVDFSQTKTTGILHLKDPSAIYGTNTVDIKGKRELTATANSLNRANLAYYATLFSNMSAVYTALQYILLVCIGGWFFAVMAIKNTNNKMESANEKQKILNTLLVPVLAFAAFFTPIPEDSGMTATPIQKIMRAGASLSNTFADRIGTVGARSYMQKLYGSVGAYTWEKEKTYRENSKNYQNIIAAYERGYKECQDRFRNISSFLNTSEGTQKFELNSKGIENEKYTFSGCQYIEYRMRSFYSLNRENQVFLEALERNLKNNELNSNLRQIDESINRRQNELGWINSTILPGMVILVENISAIEENSVANRIIEDNKNNIEKASRDRAKINQVERNKDSWMPESLANWIDDFQVATGNMAGRLMGNLSYTMLPGAGELLSGLTLSDDTIKMFTDKMPLLGKVVKAGSFVLATFLTALIYSHILNSLPLAVAIVAGAIAFLSYIIELAKYFYVTPFITAFALTTGKVNKIAEFLVTGIALFLKPILIVIFLYFAVFIYGLFNDIFMIYAMEQLNILRELQSQFWLTAVITTFQVILKIVGAIGSMYIMWSIILKAPAWLFKMVGLNDSAAAGFATEQLGQKLEKYSFQL